jgi:hypothetical protein
MVKVDMFLLSELNYSINIQHNHMKDVSMNPSLINLITTIIHGKWDSKNPLPE